MRSLDLKRRANIASAKLSPVRQWRRATKACSRADRGGIGARSSRSARGDTRAPDGMVMKAKLGHCLGVEQVAPVENNRRGHFFFYAREIDVCELRPLRCDNQRFSALHRFERGFREFRSRYRIH